MAADFSSGATWRKRKRAAFPTLWVIGLARLWQRTFNPPVGGSNPSSPAGEARERSEPLPQSELRQVPQRTAWGVPAKRAASPVGAAGRVAARSAPRGLHALGHLGSHV